MYEPPDYSKFHALEDEKRERIINAAMKEFTNGFKAASTDTMVKEAGISKGLLFHYFGTKEGLYEYLVNYATDAITKEYFGLINTDETDILESIWQSALLKQDMARRFPAIFDFMTSVYLDTKHRPSASQAAHMARFSEVQKRVTDGIMTRCDRGLFREDVDAQTIIEIIGYAMHGYAESKAKGNTAATAGENAREWYDKYLVEFRAYLNVFRKCFYKQHS